MGSNLTLTPTLSCALTVPGQAPRAHGPASLPTAWSLAGQGWQSTLLGNRNCDFHLMAALLQINEWDSKEMQTKTEKRTFSQTDFANIISGLCLGLMKRKINIKVLNN